MFDASIKLIVFGFSWINLVPFRTLSLSLSLLNECCSPPLRTFASSTPIDRRHSNSWLLCPLHRPRPRPLHHPLPRQSRPRRRPLADSWARPLSFRRSPRHLRRLLDCSSVNRTGRRRSRLRPHRRRPLPSPRPLLLLLLYSFKHMQVWFINRIVKSCRIRCGKTALTS